MMNRKDPKPNSMLTDAQERKKNIILISIRKFQDENNFSEIGKASKLSQMATVGSKLSQLGGKTATSTET